MPVKFSVHHGMPVCVLVLEYGYGHVSLADQWTAFAFLLNQPCCYTDLHGPQRHRLQVL